MVIQTTEERREYQYNYYRSNKKKIYNKKKIRQQDLQKWYNEYKTNCSCFFCNLSLPFCLDFHHVDPTKKFKSISLMISDAYSLKRIKNEIKKTIPLCSNCHRKIHFELECLSSFSSSKE